MGLLTRRLAKKHLDPHVGGQIKRKRAEKAERGERGDGNGRLASRCLNSLQVAEDGMSQESLAWLATDGLSLTRVISSQRGKRQAICGMLSVMHVLFSSTCAVMACVETSHGRSVDVM